MTPRFLGHREDRNVCCCLRWEQHCFLPLSEAMGAEVFGADPTASLDDGGSYVRGSLADYRHLLVRDGHISTANQENFAEVFGDTSIRQDYDVE